MSKKAHGPKVGREVHVLDNVTGADFERDEAGRPRVGVAGVSNVEQSLFIKAYMAILDWEIGRAVIRARLGIPQTPEGDLDFSLIWELAGLTESQRRVCDLVVVDGCSYQQVAELEGVSKSAIRDRMTLARLKIKDCFGDRSLDRRVGAVVTFPQSTADARA